MNAARHHRVAVAVAAALLAVAGVVGCTESVVRDASPPPVRPALGSLGIEPGIESSDAVVPPRVLILTRVHGH